MIRPPRVALRVPSHALEMLCPVRARRFPSTRIAALLLAMPVSLLAVASPASPPHSRLDQRERQLFRSLARASHFANVPHLPWRPCEQVNDPIALATPDPLVAPPGHANRIRVSFIIGTDGRVHSPLILESAGPAGDRYILDAVRRWRYRPATCNGVPTETEGKIEFSIR